VNEVAIIQFLLFELHVNFPLTVITVGNLDFDYLSTLPVEQALEEVEDATDKVLIEATGLKLYPNFLEAGIELTPAVTSRIAQLMYLPGSEYPFETVLSGYEDLLEQGTESETFLLALDVLDHLDPNLFLLLPQ